MRQELALQIEELSEREQSMLEEIIAAYFFAKTKFAAFHCPHEGYAVTLEELDETWDIIKRRTQTKNEPTGRNDPKLMLEEIKTVGAMALRFMVDLC